jgi:hypothetical protein
MIRFFIQCRAVDLVSYRPVSIVVGVLAVNSITQLKKWSNNLKKKTIKMNHTSNEQH